MEDIIEIYEPIYRKTFNYMPILIILISILIVTVALLIILKRKKRKLVLTPEQKYKNILNDYIELQKSITTISSRDFSNKTIYMFKSYISDFYIKGYKSSTTKEMLDRLNLDSNSRSQKLEDIFLNKLEPSQYGKFEIEDSLKHDIVKECVDFITEIYNDKGEYNA